MELVSVLAGERWSDHPRCTHPALAELARMVNDLLPDGDQARLVAHAPDLVGLWPRDLRVTPALVLLCVNAQQAAGLAGRLQRRRARRADRRLNAITTDRRNSWLVATEPFYRAISARLAMADAAYSLARGRRTSATDDLVDLLCRAIRLCSDVEHAPESAAAPSVAVGPSTS